MSLHKGNHVKPVRYVGTAGEMPDTNVRGVIAAARAIRNRHRSPFGFCSIRLSKGKAASE
jgi:hypothetical protein